MQDAIIFLSEEEMKLRAEDKEWFAGEIERQLREVVDSFKPHGWRKLVHLLRELGPIIGTCSFVLALVAAAITLAIFGFSGRTEEATFRGKTEERLKHIESSLISIEGKLGIFQAQSTAAKLATIPVKELKKHRDELVDVKKSLASLPTDTPNYWPACFQIISLLSQAIAQLETIGQQPPSIMDNVRISGFGQPSVINNQNVLLKNTIEGWNFSNSVVHFDPSVRLINVGFTNCVFIFPAGASLSKPLKQIGKALLASDLSRVTITAG